MSAPLNSSGLQLERNWICIEIIKTESDTIDNEVYFSIFEKYWNYVRKFYSSCRVRGILYKHPDKIELCSLYILFQNEESNSHQEIDYDRAILFDKSYSVESGFSIIKRLCEKKEFEYKENVFTIDDFYFNIEKRYKFFQSVNIIWPFYYVQKNLNNVTKPDEFQHLFLKPGEKYYSSESSAIIDLYNLGNYSNYMNEISSNFNQKIVVVFPNYSIRIEKVKIGVQSIWVNCVTTKDNIDDYLCKYEYRVDDKWYRGELYLKSNEFEIPISGYPNPLSILLFDNKLGFPCDQFEIQGGYLSKDNVLEYEMAEIDIDYLVQSGENKHIEFKQKIPKKEKEFLETISAFSNTEGGTLLFGVDDNGSIVGIDGDNIPNRIIDIINNKIEPSIEPTIQETFIDEKRIITVRVFEGEHKPYFVKDDTAYIRRGSTDKKISRAEMDQLYKSAKTVGTAVHRQRY